MSILKITLIGLSLSSSLLNAEFLSVQVKQTVLRDKPSFLGKSIAKLSYADQVESAATQNDWSKVKTIKGVINELNWVTRIRKIINSAATKALPRKAADFACSSCSPENR